MAAKIDIIDIDEWEMFSNAAVAQPLLGRGPLVSEKM